MSNPNGQTASASTSGVATNAGTIVQVPDLIVPANRIANFVERYRKDYFEDRGLEWCLDEILSRGMAEIKRQVKTAVKTGEQRAAGKLLASFNMTPAQAAEFLKNAVAQQMREAAEAKAKADAAKPK